MTRHRLRSRPSALVAALLSLAMLLVLHGAARASVSETQTYQASFVKEPPPLEPSQQSPIWNAGILANDFINVVTKGPASQTTVARILFTASAVWVDIQCDQPDQKITTNPRAQNFGQADFTGIGVDPSGTGQNVYYFGVTPTGTQYFLNSRIATYYPKWTAKTQVGATSWNAILVIPYDVFLLPSSSVQKWRINVVRHVQDSNDDLTWAYNSSMTVSPGQSQATSVGVGGSPESQNQQNALNAQNQAANPLGLAIWPTTTDAIYWPTVVGTIPGRLLPPVTIGAAGLVPEGLNRNLYYQQAVGGSYIQQGIPYTSYYGNYRYAPTAEVAFEGNETPLIPQVATAGAYYTRPFFMGGQNAFFPAFSPPMSSTAGPNQVIAPWNIETMTQAYKTDGVVGLESFDVMNAVGQGMNDTLIGVRHDVPAQAFSWWFDGALTHHAAGYFGVYNTPGSTQSGEFGLGGRNPHTGFTYMASYAVASGKFPTATPSPNIIVNPGQATKTVLAVGIQRPFYTATAFYSNLGPQFLPQDGAVYLAGVRGFGAEATASGAGSKDSWIKSYYLRGFGLRQFDQSGAVAYTDDEFSAYVVTKNNLNFAAGQLLTTRAAYGYGTPLFPQLVGYPVNYTNRAYGKLGNSGVLFGYGTGSSTFVNFSYMYGPNVLFTYTPQFLPGYINGSQQTYTAVAQTYLLGFKVQGSYGVNHGYYNGLTQTAIPGGQTEGQTMRYASIGRTIDPFTSLLLGYQSVVGSPYGASNPSTFFGLAFVHNLKYNAGQFSVTYGSMPLAPFFSFPRAATNWNYPSYVIGCLPSGGLCQLNRLTIIYQRNVNL